MSARSTSLWATAAATVVVFAGLTTPAVADTDGADGPELATAEVDIAVHADGSASVQTRYGLDAPLAENTEIPFLLMPHDGVEVTELASTTSGVEVDPPEPGRVTATLSAGTEEFDVEHTVERADASAAVLLAVPEIATSRTADVAITVALPEGQNPAGDTMPSFRQSTADDGTVILEHQSGDLPSVVVAGTDDQPGPRLGTALSAGGLGGLAVLFALWFLLTRGRDRKETP
ncbi:hypothetical protein J4H86_12980 [Spiractinospora alimapuensis]|uniref:hypothetical protein n=1 Tax=Spiractinospora alimapuensis TaxID=2820884 RepID=UPI001F380BF8|nr:hypothetical protein [Spiractinospora alimapuensis]QVQ54493.1 hypothetical protein J4H86_12980 [Spiractinospora alimapuensis]